MSLDDLGQVDVVEAEDRHVLGDARAEPRTPAARHRLQVGGGEDRCGRLRSPARRRASVASSRPCGANRSSDGSSASPARASSADETRAAILRRREAVRVGGMIADEPGYVDVPFGEQMRRRQLPP